MNLFKLDFLSGKKTYITLGVGIVVLWLSVLTGTNVICEFEGRFDCKPPDLQAAIQATWLAVSGLFIRKAVA